MERQLEILRDRLNQMDVETKTDANLRDILFDVVETLAVVVQQVKTMAANQ